MKFCIQLSADYADKDYGSARVYQDMLDQAVLCDQLGFDSVSLTEHHLVNCLMNPAPLLLATSIAARTQQIKIITSVVVLPLHDMRVYAGEVVMADILCDGRLMLGVGRGAFPFEMTRMGVEMEETRERFDESLDVLQKLLAEEEVEWHGKYYDFDPLTIMPRPAKPGGPAMMMGVMNPAGIAACTKRGFHILTTPLAGNHQMLVDQVGAFKTAKQEMGEAGEELSLTLSRVGFATAGAGDREAKIDLAYQYYSRFDNIYTGPGIVDAGMIRPLPRQQTREQMIESLLVGSPAEIIDQLGVYHQLGVDRIIININFGACQADTLESIHRLAEEVVPHFQQPASIAA